jgi:hypothetical protein
LLHRQYAWVLPAPSDSRMLSDAGQTNRQRRGLLAFQKELS